MPKLKITRTQLVEKFQRMGRIYFTWNVHFMAKFTTFLMISLVTRKTLTSRSKELLSTPTVPCLFNASKIPFLSKITSFWTKWKFAKYIATSESTSSGSNNKYNTYISIVVWFFDVISTLNIEHKDSIY